MTSHDTQSYPQHGRSNSKTNPKMFRPHVIMSYRILSLQSLSPIHKDPIEPNGSPIDDCVVRAVCCATIVLGRDIRCDSYCSGHDGARKCARRRLQHPRRHGSFLRVFKSSAQGLNRGSSKGDV